MVAGRVGWIAGLSRAVHAGLESGGGDRPVLCSPEGPVPIGRAFRACRILNMFRNTDMSCSRACCLSRCQQAPTQPRPPQLRPPLRHRGKNKSLLVTANQPPWCGAWYRQVLSMSYSLPDQGSVAARRCL